MANCGSYSDWTDECRRRGCEECGTLTFELQVPAGCTCKMTVGGFVFTAQRKESCPEHGRCQCGTGPKMYDSYREADFYPRKWLPKCPLISHKQEPT
jgi:hypothetical protein